MLQSRNRKGPLAVAKRAVPISNAPGDARDFLEPQPPRKSKAARKTPKNIRYELENALVGLCDVWFQEIKPHLVRNNIKIHVHGSERPAALAMADAGDVASSPPHNPGTTRECELRRLLANASSSIESAVSQAAGAATDCDAAPATELKSKLNFGQMNQSKNEISKNYPKTGRTLFGKFQNTNPTEEMNARLERCVSPPPPPPSLTSTLPRLYNETHINSRVPYKPPPKFVHTSTQTQLIVTPDRVGTRECRCGGRAPAIPQKPQYSSQLSGSKSTSSIAAHVQDTLTTSETKPARTKAMRSLFGAGQFSSPTRKKTKSPALSPHRVQGRTQTVLLASRPDRSRRPQTQSPRRSVKFELSRPLHGSLFLPQSSQTSPKQSSPRKNSRSITRTKLEEHKPPHYFARDKSKRNTRCWACLQSPQLSPRDNLFSKDLVNIIAKTYDHFEVLYHNKKAEPHPTMNLFRSRSMSPVKKRKPWR